MPSGSGVLGADTAQEMVSPVASMDRQEIAAGDRPISGTDQTDFQWIKQLGVRPTRQLHRTPRLRLGSKPDDTGAGSVTRIVRRDMNVPASPDAMSRLQHLREEKKFCEARYYPGAPTEEIRSECERLVNEFVDDALILLRSGTDREGLFTRA
jgi:hypothetical protein